MRAARRVTFAAAVLAAGLLGSQAPVLGQAAQGLSDDSSIGAGAISPGTGGVTAQPVSLEGPTTAGGSSADAGGSSSSGGGASSPYTYERKYEYRASSGLGFLCPPIEGEPPGRVYQDIRTDKATGETTTVASGCERPSTPTPSGPAGAGGGAPAPPPSPSALAVQALNKTPLPAPALTMAPDPSIPQLVNLATFLWIDPAQWHPVVASASAGAVTSTVTATPVRVVWDMGQGDSVTCNGPGAPYNPRLADDAQPSSACKFTYPASSARSPDKTFTVTATVEWHVTWAASGAPGGGDLGISRRSSTVKVRVAELQVLNTPAPRP